MSAMIAKKPHSNIPAIDIFVDMIFLSLYVELGYGTSII